MKNKIETKIQRFIMESNASKMLVDKIRKMLISQFDLYDEDEFHIDEVGKNIEITFDTTSALPKSLRLIKTKFPSAAKKGVDKIVIQNVIKETEVSMLVAPELNVDRDRATWLKKQGKDAEGLSEVEKSKSPNWVCPKCGHKDPVNTGHPLYKNGTWKPGYGMKSFCMACKKKSVHKIVAEDREMQAAGVMEDESTVSCPNCSGSGTKEGKKCWVCRGNGKLTHDAWERHYGNPDTMEK